MKTMIYIDGSNLLIEMGKCIDHRFRADKLNAPALNLVTKILFGGLSFFGEDIARRYWFGSYKGTDGDHRAYREALRRHAYEPVLFKNESGREKGVDISLTRQMLVNAFHGNCSTSVLVAGDEDYLSLVDEVKRYNQQVHVCFFKGSSSPDLRLTCDRFIDLDERLKDREVREQIETFKIGK